MSIWAPVVAAVGASALTGAAGFGTVWWQQHGSGQAADLARKRAAYHQLTSRSLSFSLRATTLRAAMEARSGLGEGIDVTLGLREPTDPLALHDWLARDSDPIYEAWSSVQVLGSVEAVDAATKLVDACAELVSVATRPGEGRGKLTSAFRGLAWTAEQEHALQAATERMADARQAFVTLARAELGPNAVRSDV
jgi:hypothetical protein